MSLILKGIDLPKDDSFCMVVGITNAGSDITIFYKDITKGKEHRGIEAIQIDRPHGRLIDANKLFYEEVGKIKPRNDEHYKAIGEFMNMITNAPTIIEAEE